MCCVFGYAIRIYVCVAIIILQLIPHAIVLGFMYRSLECKHIPKVNNLIFMFGYVAYFYRSQCVNLTELHFPPGFITPAPDRYVWYHDYPTSTPSGTPSRYTWHIQTTRQYWWWGGGGHWVIGKKKKKRHVLTPPPLNVTTSYKSASTAKLVKRYGFDNQEDPRKARFFQNFVTTDKGHYREFQKLKRPTLMKKISPSATEGYKNLKPLGAGEKSEYEIQILDEVMKFRKAGKKGSSSIKTSTGLMGKSTVAPRQAYPTKHRLVYITHGYGKENLKNQTQKPINTKFYVTHMEDKMETNLEDASRSTGGNFPETTTNTTSTTTTSTTRATILDNGKITKADSKSSTILNFKGLAKPKIPFLLPLSIESNKTIGKDELTQHVLENIKKLNPEFWDEDKIEWLISLMDPTKWILYFMKLIWGDIPANSLVTMLTQPPYLKWPTWSAISAKPSFVKLNLSTPQPPAVTFEIHRYQLQDWWTYPGDQWPAFWRDHTTEGWLQIQDLIPTQIIWPNTSPQYGWVKDWVVCFLVMDLLWTITTIILVVGAVIRVRGPASTFFYTPFLMVTFFIIVMDVVCAGYFALTIPNCLEFWDYLNFAGVRNVGQLKDPKRVWFPDYRHTYQHASWLITGFFIRFIFFWFMNVIIFFKIIHVFRRVLAQKVVTRDIIIPPKVCAIGGENPEIVPFYGPGSPLTSQSQVETVDSIQVPRYGSDLQFGSMGVPFYQNSTSPIGMGAPPPYQNIQGSWGSQGQISGIGSDSIVSNDPYGRPYTPPQMYSSAVRVDSICMGQQTRPCTPPPQICDPNMGSKFRPCPHKRPCTPCKGSSRRPSTPCDPNGPCQRPTTPPQVCDPNGPPPPPQVCDPNGPCQRPKSPSRVCDPNGPSNIPPPPPHVCDPNGPCQRPKSPPRVCDPNGPCNRPPPPSRVCDPNGPCNRPAPPPHVCDPKGPCNRPAPPKQVCDPNGPCGRSKPQSYVCDSRGPCKRPPTPEQYPQKCEPCGPCSRSSAPPPVCIRPDTPPCMPWKPSAPPPVCIRPETPPCIGFRPSTPPPVCIRPETPPICDPTDRCSRPRLQSPRGSCRGTCTPPQMYSSTCDPCLIRPPTPPGVPLPVPRRVRKSSRSRSPNQFPPRSSTPPPYNQRPFE